MQYLHRNHVLHCDLKPQNVLVTATLLRPRCGDDWHIHHGR